MNLGVWIKGPADPDADRTAGYLVAVVCVHRRTLCRWVRLCHEGCHERAHPIRGCSGDGPGAEGRDRCLRVFPTDDMLREAGLALHEKTGSCICGAVYWMVSGPAHAIEDIEIEDEERMLTAEDRAGLVLSWRRQKGKG